MATKTKSKSDIGRSSKRKGKIGELEVVNLLKAAGYNAHRSVQYCGATGDAHDVVVEGLPLHIEVKRVERLNLKQAYQQAVHDSKKMVIMSQFFFTGCHISHGWLCLVLKTSWNSVKNFIKEMLNNENEERKSHLRPHNRKRNSYRSLP